jgi:hypothetical protein
VFAHSPAPAHRKDALWTSTLYRRLAIPSMQHPTMQPKITHTHAWMAMSILGLPTRGRMARSRRLSRPSPAAAARKKLDRQSGRGTLRGVSTP